MVFDLRVDFGFGVFLIVLGVVLGVRGNFRVLELVRRMEIVYVGKDRGRGFDKNFLSFDY